MVEKFVKAAPSKSADENREAIGTMTLYIETVVNKPIFNNESGNFNTYGYLLDKFIIEQIAKGNKIMGFELELSSSAADSLTDTVNNGSYYN